MCSRGVVKQNKLSSFLCACKCLNDLQFQGTSVVGCINLSGKKLHREVGVGAVVASGSLGGVMVSTLAWNARDVGSIRPLGTILHYYKHLKNSFPKRDKRHTQNMGFQ